MKRLILMMIVAFMAQNASAQEYQGQFTNNPYAAHRANPVPMGGQFDNGSNSPKLYDRQGNFHGNLNRNPFDPNSVSNPFGRYGSPYSSDSITNPYSRVGNPYGTESPNNPYGQGLAVIGE